MSRPLAWICLVFALAGPSLTQAELADDLARSLAGSGDDVLVRPVDGGVGDEPFEATFAPTAPETGLAAPSGKIPADFASARGAGRIDGPVSDRLDRPRPSWPPPGPTRRHVWLQTFRN